MAIHQKDTTGFKVLTANYKTADNRIDITISIFMNNGLLFSTVVVTRTNGPIEGLNHKIKVLKFSYFAFQTIHNFLSVVF